jgi:hypothetical protein
MDSVPGTMTTTAMIMTVTIMNITTITSMGPTMLQCIQELVISTTGRGRHGHPCQA